MKQFVVFILSLLLITIGSFGCGYITHKALSAPEEPQVVIEQVPETVEFTLGSFEQLIMVIAFTESRFQSEALGTAGDTGILQLREIYVREVNRLYGTCYTIEDAYSPEKSLEMFLLMQQYYNPEDDIETGIYYHNKSPYYAKSVKQNLELIKRYETFRTILKNYTQYERRKTCK